MSAVALEQRPVFEKRRPLLTRSNPKVAKGEKLGYLTAILHLSPWKSSGANVCTWASPDCIAFCLNKSGRGEYSDTIQAARIRRTKELRRDPKAFVDRLKREVGNHVKLAAKHGLTAVVRLNGTSDLPWHRLKGSDGLTVLEAFPHVTFYDYTKDPGRMLEELPANYSLTFSRSEVNEDLALEILKAGGNVAVVFSTPKGRELPASWHGFPVVDGDVSDLRFKDPRGVVVGLRLKGNAAIRANREAPSGFVVQVDGEEEL